MFSVKIALNNFDIPSDVNELTLSQFYRIRSSPNDIIQRMAAVMNVEAKTLQNLPFTGKAEKEFAGACALTRGLNESMALFFQSDERFLVPKTVKIGGREIKIPDDIQELPWWPSRIVKSIIVEQMHATGRGEAFDPTDRIADVLCHYLYVPYLNSISNDMNSQGVKVDAGNEYDEKGAENFKTLVLEMNLVEAVQLANFFFLKWRKLYLSRVGRLFTRLLIWKKRLAWSGLKSLVI